MDSKTPDTAGNTIGTTRPILLAVYDGEITPDRLIDATDNPVVSAIVHDWMLADAQLRYVEAELERVSHPLQNSSNAALVKLCECQSPNMAIASIEEIEEQRRSLYRLLSEE